MVSSVLSSACVQTIAAAPPLSIDVADLVKTYPGDVKALNALSFKVTQEVFSACSDRTARASRPSSRS